MSDLRCGPVPLAIGLLFASSVAVADDDRFADFTPLASSAGPNEYEGMPIIFGNPNFEQRTIARRNSQLDELKPNSGVWDMITLNETGWKKGRYLFTVFESGTSGVQRQDLTTGDTDTIWQVPPTQTAARFDPATWTPWGTLITGEENWSCGDGLCGRLFELRNPLTAPPIFEPVDELSNLGADMVHRNVIPRTSHEGMQFDKAGNLYLVDELNGGCLLKYTPTAPFSRVMTGRADYFAAGQTLVLRVGDGNTPNATGPFTWVPITDSNGTGLPGAVTITDTNRAMSVDSRATADLPEFKCTDYQRPEDAQIQNVRGRESLYVTTTTTSEVYRLDLRSDTISVFANRDTLDLATGLPVGDALASPDNLALDNDGNVYIIEDRNGGTDDDIWFAQDLNKDGDLNDPGEGIGRWASNGTVGSEFTGLYFDLFDKDRAWVNIQHPASGNDRTIEITIRGHGPHHGNKDDD
ncbi:MAG TPA: alkaline phosphatase PhoX, partial [Gammaproteobacteria bacterium]|nr:alkaline phosphatase PhoX [Gammaproteobacteria bacterium]